MVALVRTVAYLGLEARSVEVQCQLAPGVPRFGIVGLPDKAVGESRDRVQAALAAMGLALPPKRITINLSPADLPKEGSHYDLPVALALLAAMGVTDAEQLGDWIAVGELALDGRIVASPGVLLAALHASEAERGLICPAAQGPEARWASGVPVCAAPDLISLLNHLKGHVQLPEPTPGEVEPPGHGPDLGQVKGQETARRALEIAAAGGHNLLMIGPPGAGKSLLASCLPGILPELTPAEALEVSMVQSVAGLLEGGRISRARPFRAPHHSASMAALTGGGLKVKPGEVSLAHLGVLFLDELPEFQRAVLDSLRQPLETGKVDVARANAHVSFPARVQLVAAMNPCSRVAFLPFTRMKLGCCIPLAYEREPRTLGQHLKKHRLTKGLLQRDVAAAIGVAHGTYLNWERDQKKPPVSYYPAIISWLGLEPWAAPQSLGEQLTAERRRRGLTMAKAAAAIQVDEGTFRRWESGQRQPWGRGYRRVRAFLEGPALP